MSKTCAGSCNKACASLGEGNSTKITEDPAMVQLDKQLKLAQAAFKGASDWASKMKEAQNLGCMSWKRLLPGEARCHWPW